MKKTFFFFYIISLVVFFASCEEAENIGTWDDSKPDGGLFGVTASVSDVEYDRATLTCHFTLPNHMEVTECGFSYGDSVNDHKKELKAKNLSADSLAKGLFSSELRYLNPNKHYHYSAYIKTRKKDKQYYDSNSEPQTNSDTLYFDTPARPVLVSALPATDVTFDKATLHAKISNIRLEEVVSYGFYYGIGSNYYSRKVEVGKTPTSDTFSVAVDNLNDDTEYSVSAYIVHTGSSSFQKTQRSGLQTFSTTMKPQFTHYRYQGVKEGDKYNYSLEADIELYGYTPKEAGFIVGSSNSKLSSSNIEVVHASVENGKLTATHLIKNYTYVRAYVVLEDGNEIYSSSEYLYNGRNIDN